MRAQSWPRVTWMTVSTKVLGGASELMVLVGTVLMGRGSALYAKVQARFMDYVADVREELDAEARVSTATDAPETEREFSDPQHGGASEGDAKPSGWEEYDEAGIAAGRGDR